MQFNARQHIPLILTSLALFFFVIGAASLGSAVLTRNRVVKAIELAHAAPAPAEAGDMKQDDKKTTGAATVADNRPGKTADAGTTATADGKTTATADAITSATADGKTTATADAITSASQQASTTATQSGTEMAQAKPPEVAAMEEQAKNKGRSGRSGRSGGPEGGPGGDSKVPEKLLAAMKEKPIFGKPPRQEPQLQAILGDSALISGNWVEKDKQEGPYKLLEIGNNRVKIEWEGETRELTLWNDLPVGGEGGGGGGPSMGGPPSSVRPGGPSGASRTARPLPADMPPDVRARIEESRKRREEMMKARGESAPPGAVRIEMNR